MDALYERLAKEMVDNNPDFLRKDSDQNVDQLIVKPNLLAYVGRIGAENVDTNGMMSPEVLLAKYPDHAENIKKYYEKQLADPILKKSVCAFFCRIPTMLDSGKAFTEKNAPVKVIIDKLLKSNDDFKVYIINHPSNPGQPIPVTTDQLFKMTQQEDKWFNHFKNSQDPNFRDVPQVAIYSKTGIIPAFACKILKDSNKNLVRD